MKKLLLSSILCLSAPLFSSVLPDVRLGNPEYGGTGCPAGSASVTLSPDSQSISFIFDQFVAESGGPTGKSLDRKSCNIAIPVLVPNGYSVSVFQIDYRGFNSLPYGAYSTFSVEYFFAGSSGPVYQKRFNGYLEGQYLLSNTLLAEAVTWSPCGQSVILRANASMAVRTNNAFESAMATVDSVDVAAGLIFNLKWKRC